MDEENAPNSGPDRTEPLHRLPERVLPGSFAYTSPYGGFWLQNYFARFATDLFSQKVIREEDFRQKLCQSGFLPQIMMMGNFIVERAGIIALCRQLGINSVHGEDGFFPHYETMHADPLGFCWESSLSRMTFTICTSVQRQKARALRAQWLSLPKHSLPEGIASRFVLWPMQLIGDKVNQWDLNVQDWTPLLEHFRQCLPKEYQLVIKPHPRSKESDRLNLEKWARRAPNTFLLPHGTHLQTLLRKCVAVAGANSTVLYEARLMFHKPVYAYARSWFSSHVELFMPVHVQHRPRMLNRFDWVEDNRLLRTERLDDYTDWFLAQLLARQLTRELAEKEPELFRRRVMRLSYASFIQYGEEIFSD